MQVNLVFHPAVQEAAKRVRAGEKTDIEALGLAEKLGDDLFLNALQVLSSHLSSALILRPSSALTAPLLATDLSSLSPLLSDR